MAAIRKRSGKYQVQVLKDGKTLSRTFTTKQAAVKWGKEVEVQIEQGLLATKKERLKFSTVVKRVF